MFNCVRHFIKPMFSQNSLVHWNSRHISDTPKKKKDWWELIRTVSNKRNGKREFKILLKCRLCSLKKVCHSTLLLESETLTALWPSEVISESNSFQLLWVWLYWNNDSSPNSKFHFYVWPAHKNFYKVGFKYDNGILIWNWILSYEFNEHKLNSLILQSSYVKQSRLWERWYFSCSWDMGERKP